MYQNRENIKNLILLVTDTVVLLFSYLMANYIWLGLVKGYHVLQRSEVFDTLGIVLFSFLFVIFSFNMNRDFMKRGNFEEFLYSFKINLIFASVYAIFLLIRDELGVASRGVFVFTILINITIMYASHTILKYYLLRLYKHKRTNVQLFIITTKDRAIKVIEQMEDNKECMNRICGMAIVDEDLVGQSFLHVQVKANFNTVTAHIKDNFIDEVFIDVPYSSGASLRPYIMEFENMGVAVHLNIEVLEQFDDFQKKLSMLGGIPVVTFSNNFYDANKMLIKRLIDILGALVGIVLTAIVTIFLAPILLIESPGPLVFKQKRVGKNGRYFNVYKFRSMYRDAEERKKALMEQNEMKGHMFKMTDDPRITKVGKFIRKTSIDELPQFFNVLKGDMSLVGTRPPTVDEFKAYEGYHKRRLSAKPGITGMWQVSGRSNIDDFEEVVKLDLEYIDNWSVGLDIKILLKTIAVVFRRGGAR